RLQQADHAHIDPPVAGPQRDRVARPDTKAFGQSLAYQHRVRLGNEVVERLKNVLVYARNFDLTQVIAEGRLGKRFHPQQAQRLVTQIDTAHILADHRSGSAQAKINAQAGVDLRRQTGRPAGDLVGCQPGDALGAEGE